MLYFMITVANRSRLPEFIEIYRSCGSDISMTTLGRGTADSSTLGLLGLTGSEKAVVFSFATDESWKVTRSALERRLHIDVPGTGIAFIIPVSSVAGRRELGYLTRGLTFEQGDESELTGTKRELIIVICNQGYSDTVMDAARTAGAGGGTIIHARGTGVESAEKFLGFTLASEKEVIFIVSRTEEKNSVMETIMKEAGLGSPAKAVAFSLPVTDTAGLRIFEEEL